MNSEYMHIKPGQPVYIVKGAKIKVRHGVNISHGVVKCAAKGLFFAKSTLIRGEPPLLTSYGQDLLLKDSNLDSMFLKLLGTHPRTNGRSVRYADSAMLQDIRILPCLSFRHVVK